MLASLAGKRHDINNESTAVYGFRLKQWKFMEYGLHTCDERCPDALPEGQFIVIFNVKFVETCRANRISEWLAWEPDEQDFERWEMHVKARNSLTEKEITDFQQQLDDGINWEELE